MHISPRPEGVAASGPDDPTVVDASLHLLVDGLLTSLVDGELTPSLLHVAPIEDGLDLGTRPLDGAHPTGLLLGFTAPEHWHAFGLATAGWAYPSDQRGRRDRDRTRVHVVTLVSRTGEIAHRAHADDPAIQHGLDSETPGGEQIDLLRRALGVPTDPPPCDADVYWAIQWLGRVLNADDLSTFDDALALHPAMIVLAGSDTPLPAHDASELITAFTNVTDWSTMRSLVGMERFAVPELTPDDSAWLDDGSFARFLLTRCAPLGDLRRAVDTQLRRRVAQPIGALLDALGLPRTSWPDDHAA